MNTPGPTLADIDELLGFQPALAAPGFRPVRRWEGPGQSADASGRTVMGMTFPAYEPVVEAFFAAAGRPCWQDYDYTAKDAGAWLRNPDRLARATLDEVRTVLTAIVRAERFCDGAWGAAVERGDVGRVLARLAALWRERGGPATA